MHWSILSCKYADRRTEVCRNISSVQDVQAQLKAHRNLGSEKTGAQTQTRPSKYGYGSSSFCFSCLVYLDVIIK